MKKIITTAVLATVIFSVPFVFSTANAIDCCNNQKETKGTLSVSYTAEKEVTPDTVEVSIAIKTEDKHSLQTAANKNKEISDKVYTYLKTNINTTNGDFIKTANYSARPTYYYKDGKRTLNKYEVSNNIIIHTKNIDKISTNIEKALHLGATNIESLNFSLSQKDAQCSALLEKATKEVRTRADIVAAAAGTSITGIKTIDTTCSLNQPNMPRYRNMLMAKNTMSDGVSEVTADNGVQIEAGVIKIYSTVNANFYVK